MAAAITEFPPVVVGKGCIVLFLSSFSLSKAKESLTYLWWCDEEVSSMDLLSIMRDGGYYC